MDKLDDAGNTYLDGIISAHEDTSKALQQTFHQMGSRPGSQAQDFTTGQMFILDTRNLGGYGKYSDKFTGPVCVMDEKGSRAYRLHLAAEWKIHNVLHEMLLGPYTDDQDPARQQPVRKRLPMPKPQEDPPPTDHIDTEPPPSSVTRSQRKWQLAEHDSSARKTPNRRRY